MVVGSSLESWVAAVQFVLIICVGVVVSYTDLKFGKIRNSHVVFLASAGAVLTLYQSYSQEMLMWWASSAVMSVAIPVILWWRGLIPAGDSKLLMAMGLAVPTWWYPSFAPLAFQFSVVFFLAFLLLAFPVVCAALFIGGQAMLLVECALQWIGSGVMCLSSRCQKRSADGPAMAPGFSNPASRMDFHCWMGHLDQHRKVWP